MPSVRHPQKNVWCLLVHIKRIIRQGKSVSKEEYRALPVLTGSSSETLFPAELFVFNRPIENTRKCNQVPNRQTENESLLHYVSSLFRGFFFSRYP